MKNPLQTLLIVLALGLCLLCTWQWYFETQQRQEIARLTQALYDKDIAIQGYTNAIAIRDRQITQMDNRITELREALKSNQTELVQLQQDSARNSTLLDQYKAAIETYKEQVKIANESIVRQNEALKDLVRQRDEFVNQLNESIKERNEIVAKFNELVRQVQEMQGAQTNVTRPKK